MNEPSMSYTAVHKHLSKHYPKTGECQFCHETRATEYARIHDREYSRNRIDYLELCVPCHRRYDGNLPPVLKGEDSPSARLTEAIVIEARRLYRLGECSGRELARKYGVGKTTMQHVLTRQSWRQVI